MNVGFINIYPARPHGFHAAFLENLCRLLGYSTYFLECGGSFDGCYSKLNRSGGIARCISCRMGRASTYGDNEVHKISSNLPTEILNLNEVNKGLISSAVTLNREEVESDYFNNKKLTDSISRMRLNYLRTYYSTLDLIDKKQLESLIVFNGRIDMTRAAIDAAKHANINFVTHERTFMGHGIQMHVNENILGLRDRSALNAKYDKEYLTSYQARLAGAEIAKRFLGTNFLEWRVYNAGSPELPKWPTTTTKEKIVIIPSSRSETGSHEDWATPWDLSTDGLTMFLKAIGATKDQVVVRFHPNWIQKVGKSIGQSSRKLYKDWCQNNGYHYIDSHELVSTMGLIANCDVAILNGGSAAIEAGALGKKIVCLGPSAYKGATFCRFFETIESIDNFSGLDDWISEEQIIRGTLRYVYTALARFPQYFDYVRALQTTEFIAFKGADPSRLENMIKSGNVVADDASIGSAHEEKEVINLISDRSWERLIELAPKFQSENRNQQHITKHFPYNLIDKARNHFKRGDL
jgi:hypothetical protein